MITGFDKKGVGEHFKKEFAKRLSDDDYEGAIDYLIKYSEETENPEFHLGLGMLYLLMTQDSDDSELIYMAYREFMLQIRRDPKCALAYRNLLAAEFLRRDNPDLDKYAAWFDSCGIDVSVIMNELGAAGFFNPFPTEPIDFATFFKPGEFGQIDPDYNPAQVRARTKSVQSYSYDELNGMDKRDLDELISAHEAISEKNSVADVLNGETIAKPSKIIKFRGGGKSDGGLSAEHKVLHFSEQNEDDGGGFDAFLDEEFDDEPSHEFIERLLTTLKESAEDGGLFDDFEDPNGDADDRKVSIDIVDPNRMMRLAESKYDARDYEAALDILEGISRGSDNFYFVLVMRALIYLDNENTVKAEEALKEALKLRPDGALVGTLLCRYYELVGQTDKIPATLKGIDITDFSDGDHVFRTVFRYVLKYCAESDALQLLDELIDEYNILDVRLVYAQMMYNLGDKDYALKELYTLSRIYYDDINVRYFYLMARLGADRLPVDNEAPQEILTTVVDAFMDAVERGRYDEIDRELFDYGMEFFLSLEFRNEPKLLKKMFETVRKLARKDEFDGKMRDALVSPYAEPIVKAVILSELLAKDPKRGFIAEVMYEPISSDGVMSPVDKFARGYCTAYAFTAMLCPSATDKLAAAATKLKSTDADQNEAAYYLFTKAAKGEKVYDTERVALAMGFTKSSAGRALKKFDDIKE